MSISNEQVLGFLKKHPISVGCAVLSLVLGAAIYFRAATIPAARAVLEEKSAEGERLAGNVKYGNQLKEQLDELMADNKAIETRLVRAPQLGINSQYFYKLEADTGTKLLNLTQMPAAAQVKGAPKGNFPPVGFSVNVQGNYTQLVDFLHRLENGLHFCRVLSASCSKAGTTDNDLLTLSLSVELLGLP